MENDTMFQALIKVMKLEGAVYFKHDKEKIFFIVDYAAPIKFNDKLTQAKEIWLRTYSLKLMVKYLPKPKEKAYKLMKDEHMLNLFKTFFNGN